MNKSIDNMLKEFKDASQEVFERSSDDHQMVESILDHHNDILDIPPCNPGSPLFPGIGLFNNKRLMEKITPKEHKNRKVPLDLVPPCAIFEMARAFGYGADKYGRQNWIDERAYYSVYYAAMMRHLLTWFDSEEIDPESGVSHLAHIMANCAILIYMKENNNFDDDRIGNKDLYKK